jgi:hypothetical protein
LVGRLQDLLLANPDDQQSGTWKYGPDVHPVLAVRQVGLTAFYSGKAHNEASNGEARGKISKISILVTRLKDKKVVLINSYLGKVYHNVGGCCGVQILHISTNALSPERLAYGANPPNCSRV